MPANPRAEKVISYSLVILGVFTLFLGFWQVKASIVGAGKARPTVNNSQVDNQALADEALKKQDTDADGLTDYDEINIYRTSPYLADSDSDNYSDKEEILSGNDPNCPKGQTCFTPVSNTNSNLNAGQANNLSSAGLPQVSFPARNPQAIREYFRQSGVPEDQLKLLDDNALLQLYDQLQQSISTGQAPQDLGGVVNGNASSNTNQSGPANISDLQNLSASQIRQLLLQQGASQDLLNKYSDEALRQVFLQQLADQVKKK